VGAESIRCLLKGKWGRPKNRWVLEATNRTSDWFGGPSGATAPATRPGATACLACLVRSLGQRIDHRLVLRRVEVAHAGHPLARHLVEAIDRPVRRLEADQCGGLGQRDDPLVVLDDRGV